jgi:hypothetical protein
MLNTGVTVHRTNQFLSDPLPNLKIEIIVLLKPSSVIGHAPFTILIKRFQLLHNVLHHSHRKLHKINVCNETYIVAIVS